MALNEVIRSARKAKKMPLRVLAEKTGISINFLSLLEQGRSKFPLKRLKTLMRVLDLNEERIIFSMVKDYEKKLRRSLL